MKEETIVEVYEADMEFCYLHILTIIFPCGFKDFMGYIGLGKKE